MTAGIVRSWSLGTSPSHLVVLKCGHPVESVNLLKIVASITSGNHYWGSLKKYNSEVDWNQKGNM